MKLSPAEEWQCDLSIYMTKDGPEFRFKDGRVSLTEGNDAAKNQAATAGGVTRCLPQFCGRADHFIAEAAHTIVKPVQPIGQFLDGVGLTVSNLVALNKAHIQSLYSSGCVVQGSWVHNDCCDLRLPCGSGWAGILALPQAKVSNPEDQRQNRAEGDDRQRR